MLELICLYRKSHCTPFSSFGNGLSNARSKGTEGDITHFCEQSQLVPIIMEITARDNGLNKNQTHFDDDAATCIVDLRKVQDQYDIFQNSFKGKS